MFTTSRERPWADATPIWEVANSIVSQGTFQVTTHRPWDPPAGRNGKFYGSHPLLVPLMHVPGAALSQFIQKYWPTQINLGVVLGCHLGPSAMGAMTAVFFFLLCLEHGFSLRRTTLSTLVVSFGTITWIYSRSPYSEAIQTAFFTATFFLLVRLVQKPSRTNAILFGLGLSLLFNTKTIYVLVIPAAACGFAWIHRKNWRLILQTFLWTGLALLPGIALTLFYNWIRTGSIFSDPYSGRVESVLKRGNLGVGLWGLFLSPGKSIFLYSPPLMALFLGFRNLYRNRPSTLWLMVITLVPIILFYGKFPFWHGDFAWGPRYLTFLVPVMCLFFVAALEGTASLLKSQQYLMQAVLMLTVVLGFAVQLVGATFYTDHFIRIATEARSQWLGKPNGAGGVDQYQDGTCQVCIENLYPLHYLPPFQPIRGHLWLLLHVLKGDDWVKAEADAPWHPDTTLQLNIAGSYARARIDWWGLGASFKRSVGWGILFFLSFLGGLWLWIRGAKSLTAKTS